ncbi:hypothetical protein PoB_002648900 [Plakobranchus ocellatus]|uniref:Uncharacterized protein n=1 Tax=Plakobranchus ocellatus TaxID=259542 RepID=A0AAV4A1A5_9GAST|nr:hypothetical protein PoB_002648900 [Plakobranchus ocellatus]
MDSAFGAKNSRDDGRTIKHFTLQVSPRYNRVTDRLLQVSGRALSPVSPTSLRAFVHLLTVVPRVVRVRDDACDIVHSTQTMLAEA